MSIAVYYESWAAPWVSDFKMLSLTTLPKEINCVYLAFVNPTCTYQKQSFTWNGTGLQFCQDFSVIKQSIAYLRARGVTVMLSVGGAAYPFYSFNVSNINALVEDLGCSGVDIDFEPPEGIKAADQLCTLIKSMRSTMTKEKKLSIAGFATGAWTPNGDTYRGMNIPALKNCGSLLDWVNIMAYDAGADFDVQGAYKAYRSFYSGPLYLGFEIGIQGWGNALLTKDQVVSGCNLVASDGPANGIFIWAYHSKPTNTPSCLEVVSLAASTFIKSPPSTSNVFPCPWCQKNLKILPS